MTETFFNLVDEPWVPVLDAGGRDTQVSLREVFHRADGLRTLTGELPTQSFAILRVLLAVLHRAVQGPEDTEHWAEIRDGWSQTLVDIDAYLDDFHDRFWMRHPVHPFMQVADLRTAHDETFDFSRIICDGPGSSDFITTRLAEEVERLSWSEAVRWLVHAQAFDISGIHSAAVGDPRVKSGKGYGIGTGWAGQLGGIYLVGESLRETLLYNLIAPSVVGIEGGTDDLPVWERPPLSALPEGWIPNGDASGYREPVGLVDLYTWPTRRIRIFGTPGSATGVLNCQGDKIAGQNRFLFEPMTAWRYSDPQTKKTGHDTYMPQKHSPGRAFWRGLSGLLPNVPSISRNGPPSRMAPALVKWMAELQARQLVSDKLLPINAVGIQYGTQEAVFEEMVSDSLTLPATLVTDDAAELARTAVDAVSHAENAVFALGSLAQNIALATGESPDSDGSRRKIAARAYAELDAEFRRWVLTLEPRCAPVECLNAWHRDVKRVVESLAQEVIDQSGPGALVGRVTNQQFRDAGLAQVWFRRKLRENLPGAYLDSDNSNPGQEKK
jgi:CRISPR system Cascade subunit CasA